MGTLAAGITDGDYRRLGEITDTVLGIMDTVWDYIICGVTDAVVCINVSLGSVIISLWNQLTVGYHLIKVALS